VSALLGRIPSAVGYQPTLSTDMGGMYVHLCTHCSIDLTFSAGKSVLPPLRRVQSLPCKQYTYPLMI
jgi:hypothetical protein